MILDRIEISNKNDVEIIKNYYTCVNPRCGEFGKAYATDGSNTEVTVKRQE